MCVCVCRSCNVWVFFGYSEVFPYFFLSCKANARVKLAKTGHGPHPSLCCSVVICVVPCIVCVSMCMVLLPPGVNPIAVYKYIISYHISDHNPHVACTSDRIELAMLSTVTLSKTTLHSNSQSNLSLSIECEVFVKFFLTDDKIRGAVCDKRAQY